MGKCWRVKCKVSAVSTDNGQPNWPRARSLVGAGCTICREQSGGLGCRHDIHGAWFHGYFLLSYLRDYLNTHRMREWESAWVLCPEPLDLCVFPGWLRRVIKTLIMPLQLCTIGWLRPMASLTWAVKINDAEVPLLLQHHGSSCARSNALYWQWFLWATIKSPSLALSLSSSQACISLTGHQHSCAGSRICTEPEKRIPAETRTSE